MQRGTLFQLRNLLNRRNVSVNVKGSVNAFEDFLDVITRGHILSAALEYLGMSALDGVPNPAIVDSEIWMQDDSVRREKLIEVSGQVVEKFVDLSTEFSCDRHDRHKGTIHAYACETLSLCLLLKEFKDAIREGDGDRVMAFSKYLFPIFKASGRRNYAIEAFTLLCQYYFILPPQLAEQLKWSRFINDHGYCGKNISMDLHMEHLNKLCKTSIQGLGANKSVKAIQRVGKTVGVTDDLINNFDLQNNVASISGVHNEKSMEKDLNMIIKELQEIRAFKVTSDKVHDSFKNLSTNLIRTLDEKSVKGWMVERVAQLLP